MGKEKGDSRQEGKTNKWPTILVLVESIFFYKRVAQR